MRRLAIAIVLLLLWPAGSADALSPRWELRYTKHVMLQCRLYTVDPAGGTKPWPGGKELCEKLTDNVQTRLAGSRFINGPVAAEDCVWTPGCLQQPDILYVALHVRIVRKIQGVEMNGSFIGYSQLHEIYLNPGPQTFQILGADRIDHFGGTNLDAYEKSSEFERSMFDKLEIFMWSLEIWASSERDRKRDASPK